MAQEITEDIYRLEIPLAGNPLKYLNSYLIRGQRNLLIDTGFRTEECLSAMNVQLAELRADLNQTDIFLTHLHSDHTGLAVDLHRQGCEIFVSAEDGGRMLSYGKSGAWTRSDAFFLANGFPSDILAVLRSKNPAIVNAPPPFEDYTFIGGGQELQYGGRRLEAVSIPGHTPGHLCLYIRDEGILFLGDHILFDITPNITAWSGFEDSLGHYLQSLEKIKELPVRTALPGHRSIGGNMYLRAEEIALHHQNRLDEAFAAVSGFPGSTAYFVASRMHWDIRANGWDDFPMSQRWFAVGEALAHLDRLRVLGQVSCEEDGGLFRYYPI